MQGFLPKEKPQFSSTSSGVQFSNPKSGAIGFCTRGTLVLDLEADGSMFDMLSNVVVCCVGDSWKRDAFSVLQWCGG